MNCKVILGEAGVKQHRLVVMDFKMRGRKPKKRKKRSIIKVWDLKGERGEQFKRIVRERRLERLNLGIGQDNRVENNWMDMKEVCVGERGTSGKNQRIWCVERRKVVVG